MINNISFITAHFVDFDWTSLLVRNILKFTPKEKIKEILIINQDRTLKSRLRLEVLGPLVRVVEYPRSELHFKLQLHDHAAVLNRAISDVTGDFTCIFDSDAHPTNVKWLPNCEKIFEYYDTILALQPGRVIDTHPCFMFFKKLDSNLEIFFDEGLESAKIDVGRRLGTQFLKQGNKVYLADSKYAFYGQCGFFYLDSVYHHQSGSYHESEAISKRNQIDWRNRYFKKLVIEKNKYSFTALELSRYIFLRMFNSRGSRPSSLFSGHKKN